jgi:aminoacrylate hydrolase
MPITERNGCRLHWEVDGVGPPLIVAAGLGGTANWWYGNLPALTEHFTVLAFDQRGTGKSSHVAVSSIEEMSADLIAVLDDAGIERAAYLGHSTGGAIGIATALDYPTRLASLVIYASTTCGDNYRRSVLGLRRDILESLGPEGYARYTTLLLYPPYWINRNRERIQSMQRAAASQLGDAAVQASRLNAILNFDRREELKQLSLRVMVLCCEDDILTPSYFSREFASLIPGAELVLPQRGGHAYAHTEPEEFNACVLQFLRAET